jgi:hypothetical protein
MDDAGHGFSGEEHSKQDAALSSSKARESIFAGRLDMLPMAECSNIAASLPLGPKAPTITADL